MAKPIEPTKPLTGQDAQNLLTSLKTSATAEEIARRERAATEYLSQPQTFVMKPKESRRDRSAMSEVTAKEFRENAAEIMRRAKDEPVVVLGSSGKPAMVVVCPRGKDEPCDCWESAKLRAALRDAIDFIEDGADAWGPSDDAARIIAAGWAALEVGKDGVR